MLTFLMMRPARPGLRFYRVDVTDNMFGEYSVMREWGVSGQRGRHMLVWFSNLRDACLAAEKWRRAALQWGYGMEGQME